MYVSAARVSGLSLLPGSSQFFFSAASELWLLTLPVSLLHKAGSEFRPKPSVQNRRWTRGANIQSPFNTLPWCQLLHTLPLWHWYRKRKVFCLKGHNPLCSARVCLFYTGHPLACVTLKERVWKPAERETRESLSFCGWLKSVARVAAQDPAM